MNAAMITLWLAALSADTLVGPAMATADSFYRCGQFADAVFWYGKAGESYEAAWKSARALIDLGAISECNKARRCRYYQGFAWAQKSIRISSDKPEGYLYSAIALGRMALDTAIYERIKMGRQILCYVDTCLAIDPGHHIALNVYGNWHRSLCELGWVERQFANLFLGERAATSTFDTARIAFQKAIAAAPELPWHHFDLAKTYELMGRKEDAIKEYQTVMRLTEKRPQDRHYGAKAAQRLRKLATP